VKRCTNTMSAVTRWYGVADGDIRWCAARHVLVGCDIGSRSECSCKFRNGNLGPCACPEINLSVCAVYHARGALGLLALTVL
jgi:hypothetical protein